MSAEAPYCYRMGETCTGVCPDCPPGTHPAPTAWKTGIPDAEPGDDKPFDLRDLFIIQGRPRDQ